MSTDLHRQMFADMTDKIIFDQARAAAFNYAENALERNVFPSTNAIKNLARLDESMPAHSASAEEVITLLHEYGSPATISQIGGRYFGFVSGGVVPAALAARWLSDFWDQNTPLYLTSPIASRLEEIVQSWLIELLGLPQSTVAGFVSGSSMAIFAGLAAARYRIFEKLNWDVNRQGLIDAPKIRVIASRQAHATVSKAIALLGLGTDNVEWVPADNQGRIDAAQVPELDSKSILLLQAGNVNSGAFDDFAELCHKAREANAWVHVDGAFGLWAGASSRFDHLTTGMNLADSWSADGHKTLNTPYDNGVVLCRDKEALVNALQASGSYIVYSDNRDGMLFTPEMSRRARIVDLWATLKYLGKSGIDELMHGSHQRVCQFAELLVEKGFEIHNEVVFNQLLVSCENDDLTTQTIANIQQSGICWVGGTEWQQRKVIRISVCSWATTEEDVTRSVAAFIKARDVARSKADQA